MNDIQPSICPGCSRHCDLSTPHCPRGEEYARTGTISPQEENEHHRHDRHGPGRDGEPDHAHHGGRNLDGPPHGHHGPDHPSHGHEPHGAMHEKGHMGPRPQGPRGFDDSQDYAQLSGDEKIMAQLRRLGFMCRFGIEGKGGQERIIRVLAHHGPMTQRDLTEKLGIQPGSASETIGKAERAGLLVRTPSEQDRRTVDVRLTEEGKKMAEKDPASPLQYFSEEEKQNLLKLLEKLSRTWQAAQPPFHGE